MSCFRAVIISVSFPVVYAFFFTRVPLCVGGKSPGSLAEAFLNIAKRITSAPVSFRKDFRQRILMLFSGMMEGCNLHIG